MSADNNIVPGGVWQNDKTKKCAVILLEANDGMDVVYARSNNGKVEIVSVDLDSFYLFHTYKNTVLKLLSKSGEYFFEDSANPEDAYGLVNAL